MPPSAIVATMTRRTGARLAYAHDQESTMRRWILSRWRSITNIVMCAACLSLLPACSANPRMTPIEARERPIKGGPVDTGPGSLQATRRALEGTWTLVSFSVVDASGAQRPVKASGQLTYDAYGSMTIHGKIEDEAQASATLLEYKGRIVIDTARKQFYPADLVAGRPVDETQLAPVSPDKARRYELTADTLTVTYTDAAGKPTAIASWRRAGV
jgi:hypothetical protein